MRMNVLSADDPPPTLSPVSKSATGNFVAAMACLHGCGGIGDLQNDLAAVRPEQRSPNRLASFSARARSLSVTTTTLGPM